MKINAHILRETGAAMLMSVSMIEGDPIGSGYVEFQRVVWISKSLTKQRDGRWEIPDWFARKHGLKHCGPTGRFTRIQEAI